MVGTNDKPVYLSCPESAALTADHNVDASANLTARGDLFFSDVDLADAHTFSTTGSASRSGGGAIPLTNAELLAAGAAASRASWQILARGLYSL